MKDKKLNAELEAMKIVYDALIDLTSESQIRVIKCIDILYDLELIKNEH